MDSDKIKNLQVLVGITSKLEFELNQVKDWIKSQLSDQELNEWNNVQNTDVDFGQGGQNLTSLNNFSGNGQIFTIIKPQNLQTNEDSDDEIEIIKDSRTESPNFIIPHLVSNDFPDNSETFNTSRNSEEIEEVDPLATANVKTDKYEEDIGIGTSNNKKRKLKIINIYSLKRIKSEQILESAKNWKNRSSKVLYSCPMCSKKLANINSYNRHLQLHSPTNKFPCRFCKNIYQTYNAMIKHIGHVHRGERNDFKYNCECGLGFKNKSALENHKVEAHIGLKCKYCETVFYKRNSHFQHIQRIHLICATLGCEKVFPSHDALKLHRRINHPDNRNNHQILPNMYR